MNTKKLAEMIKQLKLKYNYFSTDHPNTQLRGKLFKFIDDKKVQFLKTKQMVQVKPDDLEKGGKRMYSPADMH